MESIKESKEALEFVAELVNACDKSLADGKINLLDALAFLPILVKLPGVLNDISKVKAEYEDYSESEISELSAAFKAKLNLRNDAAEANIEAGLEVILGLSKLLGSLKVG